MGRIIKNLAAIGDFEVIDIPEDQNGSGALQILEFTGTTVTVIVEATCERNAAGADVWAALPIAVTLSALGIATFDCDGFSKIRMRRTAGDATLCRAVLSFNPW